MITSLNSLQVSTAKARSRHYVPGASPPVIEQVADRPGPEEAVEHFERKGEFNMAERSVNKAILVGRLGADAETRFTQNGTPVSRVSLAMNRQWTDSDKQVHEETDWMSIVIWNMENLAAYLTKGSKLYVEGRLQTRSYDDKDGVKRYVTEVVAQNLVLLGGNGHSSGNGNGGGASEQSERRPSPGKPSNRHRHQEPEPEEQGVQDDDIPF
jgi:single-strand DNA-binding protein